MGKDELERETDALTQLVQLINAKGDAGEINAILEKDQPSEEEER